MAPDSQLCSWVDGGAIYGGGEKQKEQVMGRRLGVLFTTWNLGCLLVIRPNLPPMGAGHYEAGGGCQGLRGLVYGWHLMRRAWMRSPGGACG